MRLITIIIFFVSFQSFSQSFKIFDQKYNDSLLVGECTLEAFKIAPYDEWFYTEYNEYHPNDSIINFLKNYINDIEITIVLGVWCSDSRREFPRFIKILDLINFDYSNLRIIAVDTKKDGVKIDINNYNIELVPTFILYKKNTELGRIIETPEKTLEFDILTFTN